MMESIIARLVGAAMLYMSYHVTFSAPCDCGPAMIAATTLFIVGVWVIVASTDKGVLALQHLRRKFYEFVADIAD